MLWHEGELTEAVVEQARRGRVRSIDTKCTKLASAVIKRMVPELLCLTGCLLELVVVCAGLNGTWKSTFGDAAVCSAVLRSLRVDMLKGPLPELKLPALRCSCSTYPAVLQRATS